MDQQAIDQGIRAADAQVEELVSAAERIPPGWTEEEAVDTIALCLWYRAGERRGLSTIYEQRNVMMAGWLAWAIVKLARERRRNAVAESRANGQSSPARG